MTAKAKTLLRGVRVFDGESFLPQLLSLIHI